MNSVRVVMAVLGLSAVACGAVACDGPFPPGGTTLKMSAGDRAIVATVYGSGNDSFTDVRPPVYIGAPGGAFEVQVRRTAYDRPMTARALVGKSWRNVPIDMLDEWDGFLDAFTLTWRDSSGAVIKSQRKTWCPNNVPRFRVRPTSSTTSRYATVCGTHPFSKGQRWGIEGGWAVRALGDTVESPTLQPGRTYTLDVHLKNALGALLGIASSERDVRFSVRAVKGSDSARPRAERTDPTAGPSGVVSQSRRAGGRVPARPKSSNARALTKADLPDLVALPPIGIGTKHEQGRDIIQFSATVWNAGQAPMVVDGYRKGTSFSMSGHQLFIRNGHAVASKDVGTMMYDPRVSHLHWHLMDFAYYDMVDSGGKQVATTPNKGFCLAPTDPIDLLQPGAVANPGDTNLATACGDKSSVWVREVLPPGWGDTYTQVRAGQTLDITDVPNGTYRLRVTANPANTLAELTRDNNVALRTVILSGEKGHRHLVAPPYELIDSEAKFGPLPEDRDADRTGGLPRSFRSADAQATPGTSTTVCLLAGHTVAG